MFELFSEAGFDILSQLVQIVSGSILSLAVYTVAVKRVRGGSFNVPKDLLIIASASVCGMLLPLGPFGIMPLLFVLLRLEFKVYQVLPVLFSNFLFNMLMPFTDPTFVWKSGINRIILAFFVGTAAGILLRGLKYGESLLRTAKIQTASDMLFSTGSLWKHIHWNISWLGVYLLCGILLNTVFYKFVKYGLINEVFSNSYTSGIPRLLARFNIVHPAFLLATGIAESLMNLTGLSAVLCIFRFKGFLLYLGYFLIWIVLLGLSVFL